MMNIPRIDKINGGYVFLINNRPFIMLAAEAHNSACTSRRYMQNVWNKAEKLHCNTVLAPVYWEFMEPKENQFDFHMAEQLITDARAHNLKLVLLWFGSWKNGLSTYAPGWVKTDLNRFPRTQDEHGVKSKILSMFHSDILAVEENAFTAFMKFIKKFDEQEKTVLAIQVENEVGILGAARDFSAYATQEYYKDVPDELLGHIGNTAKNDTNSVNRSWSNIFLEDAGEAFMCWHYAKYINQLAGSGKEQYNLPMFTNVWLKEFEDEKPGFYPCGGPQPDMLEVWKCGAPKLEVLSPDIYTFQFEKVAKQYTRSDNPLLIPETRRDKWAAANLYAAIGTYHTLCYAPFGAESIGENKSFMTQIMHTDASDKNVSGEMVQNYLSQSYQLLGNMMPLITGFYGTDKMIGFVQNSGYMTKHIKLGKYQIAVEFYHPIQDDNEFMPGAGIMIQYHENEFIFLGYGYRACLETTDAGKQLDFLSLEKGSYDANGEWIKFMDLNGDEQHVQMEETPTVLRALYYEF